MDPFEHTAEPLPPRTAGRRVAMVVAFLVIAFAGDRLLAMGLGALQAQSGFRFSKVYAEGGPPADVLVLGDSRGVNGFYAPALAKATGARVLNLSYNGMGPRLAEAILRDYLDRHPAPKLVLLDPTCVLARPGLVSELSNYAGRSERLQALIEAEDPTRAAAGRVSHLYRFNTEVFLRALFYLRKSDQTWINDYRIGEAQLQALREAEPKTELPDLDPADLEALGRIVTAARAAGADVRLVIVPYLPLYRRLLTWWPTFVDQLDAATPDAPVLDLSVAFDDVALFADGLHLNRRGAAPMVDALRAAGALRAME